MRLSWMSLKGERGEGAIGEGVDEGVECEGWGSGVVGVWW